MMHGFGDAINPYDETLDLLDDIVKEFIANMVCSCPSASLMLADGKSFRKAKRCIDSNRFDVCHPKGQEEVYARQGLTVCIAVLTTRNSFEP